MEDFDFNDTAPVPVSEQEFLMENLCVKKGRAPGGYEPPATRSAAKRWKNIHEQNMMTKLNGMHIIKKQNAQMSKEAAREIIRKIPVELLAKEWLSKEDASVDMRTYLVDHILPTLILGIERLLKEVDEKGLSATNRFEPEFNPINFLAQYLMRNNPRFSNFAEASPYVRGLREVSEEIKQELFTFEDNRLARIKAEARRKRTDRERHEQQIREGKEHRHNQLISQFTEWTQFTHRRNVELAFLQNALRSFTETVELLPAELQEVAKFGHPLESTDETEKSLSLSEFAEYISLFVEDLPDEVFQLFMTHMSKCAATQKASANRKNRRKILTNLFFFFFYGELGLLDRARIMTLFEDFWDNLIDTKDPLGTLVNPRRWPVVEVEEVDDILFDAWSEEQDGGVNESEIEEQNKYLEAIRSAIFHEAEIAAVKNKVAKEKWKNEQLEQKSEGCEETVMVEDVVERDDTTGGAEMARREAVITAEATNGEIEGIGTEAAVDEDTTEESVRDNSEVNTMARDERVGIAEQDKSSTLNVEARDESTTIESTKRDERVGIAEQDKSSTLNLEARDESTTIESSRRDECSAVETSGRLECSTLNRETRDESSILEVKITTQEENLDESVKGDEHLLTLITDNQNNNLLTEKKKNENTKCEGDDVNKDINGNVDVERGIGDSTIGTVAVHEDSLTDQDNLLAAEPKQIVMDAAPFDENRDVEIMRELVANQSKLLGSRTNSASSASAINGRRISDTTSVSKDHVQLSTFTEIYLDLPQFIQLFETFIGPEPDDKIFATLVHYVSNSYEESETEKTELLLEFREKAALAQKKTMLNSLFEKWDNDGSGYMQLEDVADVMHKFKDGQEIEAIRLGQSQLKLLSKYNDNILSKREFRLFINLVVDEMPGIETFKLFVEFLMNSVERSYAERIRGEARKKWLQQINIAAQTSGTSMDHVYKAVFQALYKDAETHGGEKRISASISMLEVNKLEPSRGELLLRYAACTPEDCQYMLGKPMYKNMKGVSFQAVDSGKPVHIPCVASHGSVYFWNYNRLPSERGGSFIAIPLKDNLKRVFGVLGVDTMIDPNKETIFITHEIQFFQGVAKAFSVGYHMVEKKRRFLRALENAISWFHIRCPHIVEIEVYFVEPSTTVPDDYVLRKMMIKDKNGAAKYISEVIRLERKDNVFRKYLFDCMETSETTVHDLHGSRHFACPIRDNEGITTGIVDLNSGYLKILPRYESREAQRMLRLLQMTHRELINMAMGDEPACILEAEDNPTISTEIMFERIMLQELRDNINRLDPQSYIEIKGYFEPPRVIADVLRATIAIFKVDQVGEGEYDDWDDLKNCLNNELIQQIKTFDPTAIPTISAAEKIEKYLKATFAVSYAEVAEQGSITSKQFYNWVCTCLTLIQHMRKFKENMENSTLVAARVEA